MKKKTDREELIDRLFGKRVIPRREVRAKLEKLEFSASRDVREALSSLPFVRVETAVPLTMEGEAKIQRRLEEYLAAPAQFEMIVNSAVVGGAVISFQGRRFDGSWAKKLENVDYEKL